jgi:uracil-DNA glycosylase family 4
MQPMIATAEQLRHSLADWLYLTGIQFETKDIVTSWQQDGFAEVPQQVIEKSSRPTVLKPANDVATVIAMPVIEPVRQFANLKDYNSYLSSWKKLGICTTSTHTVLGTGVEKPILMVIAESPDDVEDRTGTAFSGLGHQLIKQALAAAGLTEGQLYLTYLSKWRPPGGQRNIGKHEAAHLLPLLYEEMRLVAPKAVLALGESLAGLFLGDAAQAKTVMGKVLSIQNQLDNSDLPFMASQKGEILVKTQSMKKSFWLNLLSYTAALTSGVNGLPACGSPSNNVEYISDVH